MYLNSLKLKKNYKSREKNKNRNKEGDLLMRYKL